MELLVLGGTAFLGRALAQTARDRGHSVTCFARGSRPAPDGVRFVRGDRDDDDGLAAVADREWDAVIDVGRQPGQVRRAVRDLRTAHRVLVSTGNVYVGFDRPAGNAEDSPVRAPLEGDVMTDMSLYGEAKVACEQLVRASGAPATVVRSGLIAGPGDVTGRVGYWPWRFRHPTGPDVLVPDDPDFPVEVIDVRDLAAWLVDCAEQRVDGTFNAAGPPTTLGEVLARAAEVAGARVPARAVAPEVLATHGVQGWMGPRSMPLWVDDPEWRYFSVLDTTRARAAGLTTRPPAETLADTLAYEQVRTEPRAAGLTDAEEVALRRALDPPPPGSR